VIRVETTPVSDEISSSARCNGNTLPAMDDLSALDGCCGVTATQGFWWERSCAFSEHPGLLETPKRRATT
jgi:hypothetical protein